MTQEEIIALAKAGFTAKQISEIGVLGKNAPNNSGVSNNSVLPNNSGVPNNSGEQNNLQNDMLIKTIQSLMIKNANMATPETADEILANIINP